MIFMLFLIDSVKLSIYNYNAGENQQMLTPQVNSCTVGRYFGLLSLSQSSGLTFFKM